MDWIVEDSSAHTRLDQMLRKSVAELRALGPWEVEVPFLYRFWRTLLFVSMFF